MSTLSHLLFDHLQSTLIHGLNSPVSYATLFFTASDFTFTAGHIHNCVLFLLWLSLFIPSGALSPLYYIGHLLTWGVHLSSFCCFTLFMGFSRPEYWSGLPFPSPVGHILSELSTMTRPSWVALHSMAHSFIELNKAVIQVIRLVSFLWLWFQSVYPLMKKDKRLMEASWWERVTERETGSCSDRQRHVQ